LGGGWRDGQRSGDHDNGSVSRKMRSRKSLVQSELQYIVARLYPGAIWLVLTSASRAVSLEFQLAKRVT
jgi:hypothetical protein